MEAFHLAFLNWIVCVLDFDNNLLGEIPVSTQLQTFNTSSFMENPELCGAPLPKTCPNEETHDDQNNESDTR